MTFREPLFHTICAVALVHTVASQAAGVDDLDHRRFELRQQQDALNFQLQQGIRGRTQDLAPADARRVDALQLQQRLQYQQLEQQQRQREDVLRRTLPPTPEAERRIDTERDLAAQERQLQIQRFELDRQRLLQSLPRQPLQPPTQPGRLNLP
jgi:Fe2+ transport system protein B